jgi:hypothetical protein
MLSEYIKRRKLKNKERVAVVTIQREILSIISREIRYIEINEVINPAKRSPSPTQP